AINMEHSANTIANVCVGVVMIHVKTKAPELFFRYSAEAKAAYWNPIEQQAEIIRRIGPSLDPIPARGWLTFTPHPDLPGFPTHHIGNDAKGPLRQEEPQGNAERRVRPALSDSHRARPDGGVRPRGHDPPPRWHQARASRLRLRADRARRGHGGGVVPG